MTDSRIKSSNFKWIETTKLDGKPMYPILLDIVESLNTNLTNKLKEICSEIIPTYEQLLDLELTGNCIKLTDINQYDYSQESYFLNKLAYEISLLDTNSGIIFHHPEKYDLSSKKFFYSLIARTQITNLNIAIDGYKNAFLVSEYYKYFDEFKKINYNHIKPNIDDIQDRAVQFVALNSHGLPVNILQSLVDHYEENSFSVYDGPLGKKWLFLPKNIRNRVYQKMPSNIRRNLHIKIFDAWDPTDWGYLRRGSHAVIARDTKRILQQYSEYVQGMKVIGKDFLYSSFFTLSKLKDTNSHIKLCSLVSTARLASNIQSKKKGRLDVSIAYYQQAIKKCDNIFTKIQLINEIALLYAYQKNSLSLYKSRQWYELGFSILPNIPQESERIHAKILLNNGLALVEYHEGNNHKALSLELDALKIISKNPKIREWAFQLLNYNIFKLMIRRLNDEKKAITYLRKNLDSKLPKVQEYTRIELAKYYFDKKNYHEVVDLLSIMYEQSDSKFEIKNKKEEMLGRFMFTISLLTIEERKRAKNQIPFLQYLCDVFISDGGNNLVEKISKFCF